MTNFDQLSLATTTPGTSVLEAAVFAGVSTDATLTGTGLSGAPLGVVAQHSLKRGSGSGNYSITATSFADIDTTNLKATLTVPLGSVAIAWFNCVPTAAAAHTLEFGVA